MIRVKRVCQKCGERSRPGNRVWKSGLCTRCIENIPSKLRAWYTEKAKRS